MKKSRLATVVGFLGLTSMACGVRTMIGDVPDGGNPSYSTLGAGGSGTCAPLQDPDDHTFTPPAGVSGTWTGYFESTSLAVGDDAIKLTIDQAADGSNQIHIVFGSKPAPAPATSATDRYPTDPSALADPPPSGPGFISSPLFFMPGFSYPTHEVQWVGQRLKFGVSIDEAWDSWCKLQKSYWTQQPGSDQRYYSCVPGLGWSSQPTGDGGVECFGLLDGQQIPLSCDQVSMCSARYCQCDECGCAAPVAAPPFFDITFDGDVATGSGPPGNVSAASLRLTRS
jgi:hypothetical protein